MTDEKETMAKEKFKLLYDSYDDVHKRFVTNAYTTTTIMLVILGWLLSDTDSSTKALKSSWLILWGARAIIVAAALSIISAFWRLKSVSTRLRAKLDKLKYVDSSFYDQHDIPGRIMAPAIGLNVLLCTLICALLFGM